MVLVEPKQGFDSNLCPRRTPGTANSSSTLGAPATDPIQVREKQNPIRNRGITSMSRGPYS